MTDRQRDERRVHGEGDRLIREYMQFTRTRPEQFGQRFDTPRGQQVGRSSKGGFGFNREFWGHTIGGHSSGRYAPRGWGFNQGHGMRGGRGLGGRGWQRFEPEHKHGGRSFDGLQRFLQEACKGKQREEIYVPEKMEEMVKIQQDRVGGDVEMGDAVEGDEQEGGELKYGFNCARCTKKGHVAAKCNR